MLKESTDFASHWVNLASSKLGASAVICSDDFFAPMQRMLNDEPPVWKEGVYDDHGKWMDGWESRRKRVPGHDWCIVQLAKPGVIHGIELETTFFTGNYPPAASIEACFTDKEIPDPDQIWQEILVRQELSGDSQYQYQIVNDTVFSHVRLNIYPDGGVARLRVYAEPKVEWEQIEDHELVDLAAALNGGVAITCNDQHYGNIRNLLTPGRGLNMGDGWETRRRREPGHDWVIIALAHPGYVKQVEIDTAHFKGNYPDRIDIQAALLRAVDVNSLVSESERWPTLLPESKLSADQLHHFEVSQQTEPVSHIRINIHPDGGLSRVRVFSTLKQA